jgi:hypothetical protein
MGKGAELTTDQLKIHNQKRRDQRKRKKEHQKEFLKQREELRAQLDEHKQEETT